MENTKYTEDQLDEMSIKQLYEIICEIAEKKNVAIKDICLTKHTEMMIDAILESQEDIRGS